MVATPRRRRLSYVIPSPKDPPPRLQLPPHGYPRNGSIGPIIIPLQTQDEAPTEDKRRRSHHPRHRLGVSCLALDASTELVGRGSPEGILYSGGRDGLVISWDIGIPTKKRTKRYGVSTDSLRRSTGRWEVMTGWVDDVPEDDMEDTEEAKSDGDILGDVRESGGRRRRRALDSVDDIPFVEQWETDMDAFQAGTRSRFRQSAQVHSDWVNDIVLTNQNQTASSDGTVKAWNPHANSEPNIIGQHADYVRCLSYCRAQNWVASGSFDRTVKLWDLANVPSSNSDPLITLNAPEGSGPKASIYALATDPYGGIIATGSPERVIRIWDPRSGKRVGKLVGHTDNIRAILVSEDARYLLTGSADASIKLWSLASQRCLHTFTHHTESVWSLFSNHPSLESFYSGDRSGLVCKVDVEDCTDVSEGECVVICQESNERGSNEGVSKIVAIDDNLLWTASGNSSIRRWRAPGPRSLRASAYATLGDGALIDSPTGSDFPSMTSTSIKRRSLDMPPRTPPSPTRQGHEPRLSLTPSLSGSLVSDNLAYAQDKEGDETWYGIPFESLVRLTSPNETFSSFGMLRGRDPEIATLYSAASVMSVPRVIRSPLQATFQNSQMQRSSSPMPGDLAFSRAEETLHPLKAARQEYLEREVAADAVPLQSTPDEVISGEHGLVRSVILNDRMHALTVDTAGVVAVWDILRGTNASDRSGEVESSPREALETVRELIEGEAVVAPWATVDTKTGALTVHLSDKCFDAEIYADEAGYPTERQFNDEIRLTEDAPLSHPDILLPMVPVQRYLSLVNGTTRSSPLLTPMIPIAAARRESLLSPIPQSPGSTDATPMARPQRSHTTDSSTSSGREGDYFSMRSRQPTSTTMTTPDDFSGWGGPATSKLTPAPETPAAAPPPPSTPSTPSTGFMNRFKVFGAKSKRHTTEFTTSSGSSHIGEASSASADAASSPVPKTPLQHLLAEPITPPSSNEAPTLPIPSDTAMIISEEAMSGWTTIYRGNISDTGNDVRVLEETMPVWLLEYLLANKTPTITIVKISFVLLPYPVKEGEEQLPELLNTSQAKLTASRFLRVKKLTHHYTRTNFTAVIVRFTVYVAADNSVAVACEVRIRVACSRGRGVRDLVQRHGVAAEHDAGGVIVAEPRHRSTGDDSESQSASVQMGELEKGLGIPWQESGMRDSPVVYGFFDPEVALARKAYLVYMAKVTFFVIIIMWASLPAFWGALSNSASLTDQLTVWYIDRDDSRVGHAIWDGIANYSGPALPLGWQVVNPLVAGSDEDIIGSVVTDQVWAAVVVEANATSTLTLARQNGDVTYNPASAITVYYSQARQEVATGTYLIPNLEHTLKAVISGWATGAAQRYFAQISPGNTTNTTAIQMLSIAPQTISPAIDFTEVNLRPYTTPAALAVTLVGNIFLVIFGFFTVVANNHARTLIAPSLNLGSYLAMRVLVPLAMYIPLSLSFNLISLAFGLPFGGKYSPGAGFMIAWVFVWLGLAAVALSLEAMVTVLTVQFIPYFLFVLIVYNIAPVLLPNELQSPIFAYGQGFPVPNLSDALRAIFFNTQQNPGHNAGVIVAWIVLSIFTLCIFTSFLHHREHKAKVVAH
ncbi:hypothetical protein EUX98_g7852 [Antrodiella citrinella]|uniref:DUF3533 domain-containing protein n=1 Tax=Antrodiella citrinella TaxID=2447956 RepID=A0A4S4MMU4_9APHY|nr:hypothetical protein EUX98_g7852 [Antrodiella citrinella]